MTNHEATRRFDRVIWICLFAVWTCLITACSSPSIDDRDADVADAAAVAADGTQADASRPHVLCAVGDSITGGYGQVATQDGGYRSRLAAMRPDFAWVGRLDNFGPNEGHSGWKVWQIRSFVLPVIDELAPDTILLEIGTNDISNDVIVEDLAEDYALLAHQFLRHPSVTHVYVSTLPPRTDSTARNEATARLNAMLLSTPGDDPRISWVDIGGSLTTSQLWDMLHPNTNGYMQMAERWNTVLP